MAACKIILVRHGVTVWNRDDRLQGQLDIPLSDAGRGQALALGRALSGTPLDAAFTSDLTRSSETASLCLRGRGITGIEDARLRERHYGVWQGRLRSEIQAVAGGGPREQAPGSFAGAPEGGESWARMRGRVARALDDFVAGHQGGSLLVVAHGGTLRAAFCHLLNLPGSARRSLRVDNACICEFEVG